MRLCSGSAAHRRACSSRSRSSIFSTRRCRCCSRRCSCATHLSGCVSFATITCSSVFSRSALSSCRICCKAPSTCTDPVQYLQHRRALRRPCCTVMRVLREFSAAAVQVITRYLSTIRCDMQNPRHARTRAVGAMAAPSGRCIPASAAGQRGSPRSAAARSSPSACRSALPTRRRARALAPENPSGIRRARLRPAGGPPQFWLLCERLPWQRICPRAAEAHAPHAASQRPLVAVPPAAGFTRNTNSSSTRSSTLGGHTSSLRACSAVR